MSDIVERLRDSDTTRRIGESYADVHHRRQADRDEAADEITRLTAEVERLTEWNREIAVNARELVAENERLQEALRPFAGMFLYPDDLGYEASSDIKEDLDWDDDANDMNTENVFVLRRDIRRARAALEASDDQ